MATSSKSAFISDDIAKYVNSCCEDDDFVEDIGEGCPSGSDEECPITSELESDCSDVFVPLKRKRVLVITESSDSYSTYENVEDLYNSSFPVFIETQPGQDLYVQSSLSFLESPGPKHAPPQDAKPIEYFDMFFTLALWNLMVAETNRYGNQFLRSQQQISPNSRVRQWRPVNVLEMKAFVAVLLEMGITQRPTIFSYWDRNSRAIPWFGNMFSRNRFQLILKFFHLVDNEKLFPPDHQNYDPCSQFMPLVEHANRLFGFHYTPHQHLSIDESLIQYLPNKKHHKWVIKYWMLCDSVVHYCLGFFCYQGAKCEEKAEIKKKGLGHVVVTKLLQLGNYLNKGYHVVIDNFFTSIALAKYLFENATYLTGTIRANRRFLPKDITADYEIGQVKYFRSDEILLCGFRENKSKKKPVLLLSTHAVAENEILHRRRYSQEREISRPAIINQYNKFMGGLDVSDMMLYTYLDERRTLKYWKKVVFSIFARMVLNSYIIYKENTSGRIMSRVQFTSSIIQAIEQEWLAEKSSNSISLVPMKQAGDALLRKLPGRNLRCVVCSNKDGGPVKRSNTVCAKCGKGLHGLCVGKHSC